MAFLDYNAIWGEMRLRNPQIWPIWPIILPCAKKAKRRLEIGAGTLPKFPIKGTYFLDTSQNAIEKLNQKGGRGIVLDAEQNFPFLNESFDLIGAFEVLEHLERPENTFQEVMRILRPGGTFLFSVPIHKKYWSQWDEFAGHIQRFEPEKLAGSLVKHGFTIECCFVLRRALKISFFRYAKKLGLMFVLMFPQAPYAWDICFYPFTWILRLITHPCRYSSLSEIPPDGLSLFVVCRKGGYPN